MTSSSARARTIGLTAGALALLVIVLFAAGCRQSTVTLMLPGQTTLPGQTRLWSFESDPLGGSPHNSRLFAGAWQIKADGGSLTPPNMLCQVETARFPAILLTDDEYVDLELSAGFFSLRGNEDRAAGIIFRVRDANNYYIVRANALEENVSLYKYQNGVRTLIDSDKAAVKTGAWQRLTVRAKGDSIRAYLDDKAILTAHDDTFRSGGVGLWTKADSRTCFDDVRATKSAGPEIS